ncbi:MAG TPA: TMEM175 family protein [Longimicrobium sp.]|nr:TMEM175 family protein [Longimicrobium sp.]
MMAERTADARGFRWRGREVSRLEALSDAVFGFAITLLVVSLEVPRTFGELMAAMRGLVAFAACFALLFLVWYHQYRFFRRYGLEDGVTIALNGVLLFVIVFFVYPLKFVFGYAIGKMMGEPGYVLAADGARLPKLTEADAPLMMVVYGAGYMAVFLVFALLHLHALRRREALELNALEVYDTVDNVRESLLNVGVGVLSIVLALYGGPGGPMLAGLCYWLVGPVLAINGIIAGRGRKRLLAATPSPAPTVAARPALE